MKVKVRLEFELFEYVWNSRAAEIEWNQVPSNLNAVEFDETVVLVVPVMSPWTGQVNKAARRARQRWKERRGDIAR